MSLVIQPLLLTDLDETEAVLKAAYKISSSREETLRRYLSLQPDGALIVKQHARVVGFGAAMNYGPFAYIGLMAVEPSMQKRGIGQMLLEQLLSWLETQGCPTVLLDATPYGAPLYERYGFREESRTLVMRRTQDISLPPQFSRECLPVREQDLPGLIAFDAAQFGADRGGVLRLYGATVAGRAWLKRDSTGSLVGYVVAQPGTIGPFVVRDAESGEQLLREALNVSFEHRPGIFVSAANQAALRLFAGYGFSEERSLSHMFLGEKIQRGRATTLYGQTSLGLG